MATARKDNNFVNTMTGVLNSDGQTIELMLASPTKHALKISDGTTGSNNGPQDALKDSNNTSTLLAVSSADGLTIVPLYCDSNGNLLVKSS